MDIGKEKRTIIVEPVTNPVPAKEPAKPAPAVTPKPDKQPAKV